MKPVLISIMILSLAAFARADEIQQAIDEGTAAFKDGRFSEAASQFDLASQLLREKSGGVVAEALPEAPEGWVADGEPSVDVMSAGFMGGMTNVSRSYGKEGGDGSIDIQIVADSPMIAQMSMVLSNPAMVRQMGKKIVKIGDGRAILDFENGSGTLTEIVRNRYLVTVRGDGVTEADMTLFAEAVDRSKLNAR